MVCPQCDCEDLIDITTMDEYELWFMCSFCGRQGPMRDFERRPSKYPGLYRPGPLTRLWRSLVRWWCSNPTQTG